MSWNSDEEIEQPRRDLREEAERRLSEQGNSESQHIEQIELELQNEELQRYHGRLVRLYRDYQQLFEHAPVAFVTLNESGAVLRMNDRARMLLGDFAPEEVFEDRADGDARGLLRSMLARIGSGQTYSQFDARLRGNRRRRIEASIVARHLTRSPDEPNEILLAIEDRTAFRQTQRALVRSERELRSLLNVAPDGMCIVQDHKYVYVNEAWAAMLGRPRARLAQGTIFDNVAEADRAIIESLLDVSGASSPPATVRLQSVEGVERTIELRAMPIEYRTFPAVFLVARDLTERRRLEARMAQSERLATVGLLVAGVAHEINNPLTFVHANLDELRHRLQDLEGPGVDDLCQLLDEARSGTARVERIVGDLRTFQRSEDDSREVDPNRVVVETLRMVGPKILHRANVRRDLGRLSPIVCNEARLVQVLTNLVLNAVEAMPEERPPDHNEVAVHTWQTEGDVCIKVEDNGLGIAANDLKQIFDPFFTRRKGSGGTGLGLAISNSIVQQMGGFISVDSEVGVGSRFVVHLPVEPTDHQTASLSASPGLETPPEPEPEPAPTVHGPETRAADATAPSTGAPPSNLRVLLVDDEELTLRALSRAMKKIGRSVTASSGRAAMSLLAEDEGFDVIVTDMIMAEGSGRDLIDWVQSNRPHLLDRMVVMTGMTHPNVDAPREIPLVRKPFDLDEFRRLVQDVARSAGETRPRG